MDLSRCRELEAERQQTLRRLAGLTDDFDEVVEASRNSNADDKHDPEGATIAFERSQVAALVHQVRGHPGGGRGCDPATGGRHLRGL